MLHVFDETDALDEVVVHTDREHITFVYLNEVFSWVENSDSMAERRCTSLG
jgi:hypothetical protein